MRGKGERIRSGTLAQGITPACAGKSSLRWAAIQTHGDHPRVCGEKLEHCGLYRSALGSPPRVRGKDHRKPERNQRPGITPACAGKRHGSWRRVCSNGDHPRVCGEKLGIFTRSGALLGSPPRVRGKVVWSRMFQHFIGITPACAGKRPCRTMLSCRPQDHPRVCGEKCAWLQGFAFRTGSPPRVRGKVPSSI